MGEESKIQAAYIKAVRLLFPCVPVYAIKNEGRRTNGGRMVSEGMLKGIPDVCIPVQRNEYGALYIEFKSRNGRLSAAQKKICKQLADCGNIVLVCTTTQEAIDATIEYLGAKQWKL